MTKGTLSALCAKAPARRLALIAMFSVDAELQMVDVYIDRDGDVSGADLRQGLFGKITIERDWLRDRQRACDY